MNGRTSRQTRLALQLSLLLPLIILLTISPLSASQNGAGGPAITIGTVNPNGQTITVSGSTFSQSSPISTVTWNWGDGQITTGSFPQSHFYSPGTWTIIITAQDSSGNTGTATVEVNVESLNEQESQLQSLPPQIAVDTPTVASDGATVTIGGFAGAGTSGESIASINWNWGDGQSSSGGFPQSHFYTSQGAHQVTITVTDNNGNTATTTTTASTSNNQVTTSPTMPLISASDQVSGLQVTLTGNIKAQAEGASIDWSRSNINWGDGTQSSFGAFSHIYQKYQPYNIQLTVYDTLGNEAQQTIPINLAPPSNVGGNSASNVAPVVNINIIQNGLTLKLTGSAVPNPLVSGASIASLLIDWGDGTTTNGYTQYTHTYSHAFTYTIRVSAVDSYGDIATVSQDVAVTPSIVTPGAGGSTSGGSSTCSANPTIKLNNPSISGAIVSVSGTPGPSVTSGTIDWGDGTSTTPLTQYTHTYSAVRTYTITVTVSDACGNTATATTQAAVTVAGSASPAISATATVNGYVVDVTGTLQAAAQGASIDYTKSTINWGDGQTTPVTQFTHTYPSTTNNNAPITILVTAVDTLGNTMTKSLSVTVPGTSSASAGSAQKCTLPTISLNQPSITGLTVDVSGNPGPSVTSGTIDWGDGTTTPLTQYVHTYASAQPYTIIVTVFDACGDNNVASQSADLVTGVAAPPIISVTPSISGLTLTLSGTIKADPSSGATLNQQGTTVDWGDHMITQYPTYQHTYAQGGTYNIIIVARDTHGNFNSAELTVTVGSTPTVSVG